MKCPCCNAEIPDSEILRYAAGLAGRVKSEKKAAAVRENGKKGGRPPKRKEGQEEDIQKNPIT